MQGRRASSRRVATSALRRSNSASSAIGGMQEHGVDVRQSRKAAQQDIVGIKLRKSRHRVVGQHAVLKRASARATARSPRPCPPRRVARCADGCAAAPAPRSSAPASAAPRDLPARARTRRRPARFPARRTPAASLPSAGAGTSAPGAARRVRSRHRRTAASAPAGRLAESASSRPSASPVPSSTTPLMPARRCAGRPATRRASAARRRPRRVRPGAKCGVRAAIGQQREMPAPLRIAPGIAVGAVGATERARDIDRRGSREHARKLGQQQDRAGHALSRGSAPRGFRTRGCRRAPRC